MTRESQGFQHEAQAEVLPRPIFWPQDVILSGAKNLSATYGMLRPDFVGTQHDIHLVL